MIGVAYRYCAGSSQPFGKIEHARAIDSIRDDRVLHRMQQPLFAATGAQRIVTRVLGKYCGVGKFLEKVRSGIAGHICTEPFSVSRRPLAIRRVVIFSLADSRVEAGAEKCDWIDGILDKQQKFVFRRERAE